MFLLRRAAARGLQTKSLVFQSSTRTYISSSALVTRSQPQIRQQWAQRRLYSDEAEKSKSNVSPAEAEGGETVTTEPSAAEQKSEIEEESIATSEVTDGAQSSEPAVSSESKPMGMEPGDAAPEPEQKSEIAEESIATSEVTDGAQSSEPAVSSESNPMAMEPGDAAPEPEHTSAATSSATETASSTVETIQEKASDTLSAASDAASGAAAAATGAIRGRGDRRAPEPSKILYCGNLFFDLTPERLRAAFEPYGTVVNCKIVTDSSGLSKGFGYVEFEHLDEATRAIQELDQSELEGRRLACQYHVRRQRTNKPRGPTNPPSKTLFIGNMSFQMSDKDLNDLFRQVKNVLDVRVAIDRRSGQPRGFAHADFTDTASAEKAKAHLETRVIYGRQLKVDFGVSSSSSRQRQG